jgi:hypothetical protein
MQYNTLTVPYLQTGGSQSGTLDLASLLGVRIGQDTSNNFAITPMGLAILGRDSRYYSLEEHEGRLRLMDVSSLVLPINPGVFRVPVEEVHFGDLILISDSPFSAMFVHEVHHHGREIHGLEVTSNERIQYLPPHNPFGELLFGHRTNLYVRFVSVLDLLSDLF